MFRTLATVTLALSLPGLATAADAYITQQGRLLDATGTPVDGLHTVRVTLYTDAGGATSAWRSTFTNVSFDDGYYAIPLTGDDDDSTPRSLDDALAGSPELYLGLSIDNAPELTPRQRVGSAAATSSGSGVGETLAQAGEACDNAGEFAWNDADQAFLGCSGSQWFLMGSAPTGAHRFWRVRLVENDGGGNNYLGGFTVFASAGGGGTNYGTLAGPQAVTVYGADAGTGSIWDPSHDGRFTTLASTTSTNGGRVQCRNGVYATGNCWVQIDLTTPQQVASWGILSRQNASTAHWTGVVLEASNDAATWVTIDTRLGLNPTQAQSFVWDVTTSSGPTIPGSCREHLNADSSLAGQDGPYLIDTTGDGSTDLTVHCDMTRDGGGWTLVMQGYHGTNASISNAQWNTTGSLNISALAAGQSLTAINQTAKMSDALIDKIAEDGNAQDRARFRIDDNHGNTNTDYGQFFVPQSCTYAHTAQVSANPECGRWNRSPDFAGPGGQSVSVAARLGIDIAGTGPGFPAGAGEAAFNSNYNDGNFKKFIVDNQHDEDSTGSALNWQLWVR